MKKIGKFFAAILIGACAIILLMQGLTPVYDFAPARPFSGDTLHNPYAGMDSVNFAGDFRKINTHAHQTMVNGLVEFPEYTIDEFKKEYRDAGYSIAVISDHQYLNKNSPIPIYEHGVNFMNYHIQCYGAQSVWWIDFPVMLRPRHQMYWFMDQLKGTLPLIAFNHPSRLRMGANENHVKVVKGYDLMEMDHHGSRGPWDAALSEGHYSTMIATDDGHNRDSLTHRFQNRYTMAAIGDNLSANNLYATLKQGQSYGVELLVGTSPRGAGTEPKLKNIKVLDDTLIVELLEPAKFLFFGQEGKIVAEAVDTTAASYIFTPEDTYIRTEITLDNGMTIWLNPVARISALDPMEDATIIVWATVLNSLLWTVLSLIVVWSIFRMYGRGGKRLRIGNWELKIEN